MPILIVPPCQPCRRRHLKCDGAKPVCSRCRRLGKKCNFPGLAIRNGGQGLKFADDQPWVELSGTKVRFVDESLDIAHYYGHKLPPAILKLSKLQASDLSQLNTNREPSRSTNHRPLASHTGFGSPCGRHSFAESEHSPSHFSGSNSPIPRIQSFWPRKKIQEAYLMRYFVEEIAQWFDSCDESRNFALIAPHRAADCPALLYAILSTSARHISQRRGFNTANSPSRTLDVPPVESEVAIEYQNLCISHLMSLCGDEAEVQDENLLAAAVVLRFYEEIDAPLVGVDDETYLRGTHVFLEAQAISAMAMIGSLQNAALWVGFRQEFHSAFIKQRPFRFDLACCESSTYKDLTSADDSTWANRIVLHCAEILNSSYGSESHDTERYARLLEYSDRWFDLKPSSFDPIYDEPASTKGKGVFPHVWFFGDCHVTAIQHWHLARILLAAFDPNIPQMGPTQKREAALRDFNIKQNIFRLCGIACSNKTAPGLITASMGISMCGDRVTDRSEQDALLEILVRTEDEHFLSTGNAQRELREAWDWDVTI